jgi:polyisoprenoid-binding protein YceI
LIFAVDHLGFSNYRATFSSWDAKLNLDVANPARSSVEASVDLRSLQLQGAPKGFQEELIGPNWINTPKTATAIFKSTRVTLIGPRTAKVAGNLTLNGVTKPVEMRMTLNGGYRGHPMDPNARVGFSGEGVFKRSAFGISAGIPAPGSTMGVGDDVRFSIEAELTGPPLKQ